MEDPADDETSQRLNTSELGYIVSERDFVSLLIDLYRNKPVLWKVKHKQYIDKRARVEALDEITKELQTFKPDFSVEKLKKKINIIRTNFNKEKHRVEKWRAEGRADAKPGLWYFNELLFLEDQETKGSSFRRSSSNNSDVPDYSVAADYSDAEDQKYMPETEDQIGEEIEIIPEPDAQETRPKQKTYKNIAVKRRRVEDTSWEPDEEEDKSPEQYMTVTTTYYKKPEKREDLLAKTWAMKLKKLTREQKLYAEKIINDVLFEGELGNLTKNGVSFCPAF